MKIAKIKDPIKFNNKDLISQLRKDSLDYGVGVESYDRFPELDIFKPDAYLPNSWIGCRFAFPHTDSHFGNANFLTLVVRGKNFVFGSEDFPEGYSVPEGTLFEVDARKTHWLFEKDWKINKFFLAIQWEIHQDEFEEKVKQIIDNFSAEFEQNIY